MIFRDCAGSLPAMNDLNPVEVRILGCLIEKQRTTPDTYPLTLNALRLACNQSTNRDPVVDYDEDLIHEALQRMHRRELTRAASGHGSRSSKYRHLVPETLGLSEPEQAVVCVLLLRGDQTPGELKTRTERLHPFTDLEAIDATLEGLIEKDIVQRLERRPGEKQVRYRQLLGGEDSMETEVVVQSFYDRDAAPAPETIEQPDDLAATVAALQIQVQSLTEEVAELRARLEV